MDIIVTLSIMDKIVTLSIPRLSIACDTKNNRFS
jgi:hypothetical protein